MKYLGLLLCLLAGCCYNDSAGNRHYVVVGFGVVSVCDTNTGIHVYKTQSVGLAVSDVPGSRFSLGYANNITLTVDTNVSDAMIEVVDTPMEPMRVIMR